MTKPYRIDFRPRSYAKKIFFLKTLIEALFSVFTSASTCFTDNWRYTQRTIPLTISVAKPCP